MNSTPVHSFLRRESFQQIQSNGNENQKLYNTLILPLFDYCSSVWDSYGAGSKAYLDKLNSRAASIIEGRTVCTEELRFCTRLAQLTVS